MGYQEITLKLPTSYSDGELQQSICKKLKLRDFTFQIINKSLDARKRSNIHWNIRVGVYSNQLKGEEKGKADVLELIYKNRNKKILVVGSGPAGMFSAMVLQRSGYHVILIERGSEVKTRTRGIRTFEKESIFSSVSNYAFGEGGAGTFSDGKLTSRSKRISKEKDFITGTYIAAGAPEEIAFMKHPHLGTDNLRRIVENLRLEFKKLGGKILFENQLMDLISSHGRVKMAITEQDEITADYFIIAPGHSAYDTYRMLIHRKVPFRTKNFALGSRVEHLQEIINRAQWGKSSLKGVKAADYRLSSQGDGKHAVYTFCMCPGGMVVPATAYEGLNIVNGMSYYQRNGQFANAACVAGLHPDQLAGKKLDALEALDQLESLEKSFYDLKNNYAAPFCTIKDFLSQKIITETAESTYPLGLTPAPLWEMLPEFIVQSMQAGLRDFKRKIVGYEKGILLGFESKTSSPIQVIREASGLVTGFSNLFIVGEGSGYAGGIMSSAADGVKTAMKIIESDQ